MHKNKKSLSGANVPPPDSLAGKMFGRANCIRSASARVPLMQMPTCHMSEGLI
jgi:hypothetical protein